ncbi:MAG: M20/M25/M40 family metallo-hydrolase [Clostridia bacterium]|nr:M20/M25/M40 family metallo-hydrolase [Clostridia bacterium]
MTEYKSYAECNYNKALELLRELGKIPAPSHCEDKRAEFCRDFLKSLGADNAYIDNAKNVIYEINCESSNDITIFLAHTDTVFPDTEPYTMTEDEEKIYCPGIGDDTASVVVLLMLAKYYTENRINPKNGVMFVMNSCEEGLGNLFGIKTLMESYKSRIGRVISFDACIGTIYNKCVGSHRYKVTVQTEGGHSFGKFGNKNAIAELSSVINEIYKINVPQKEGTKTTYNVGNIVGGTSINTIAQEAEMLCEYRSDDRECLEIMQKKFFDIFDGARKDDVKIEVSLIGERPCAGEVDEKLLCELTEKCQTVMREFRSDVSLKSASTDCNIPMSVGVPAVTIGVYTGDGEHTREEFIIKESIKEGIEIALKTAHSILEI